MSGNIINLIDECINKYNGVAKWQTELTITGQRNRELYYWYNVTNLDQKLPSSGWKLHVSGHLFNYKQIVSRVVPKLLSLDVSFKVAASESFIAYLTIPELSGYQAGKFITIYPSSSEQSVAIARILDVATRSFSAIPVKTDRPVSPGSIIYYRYGAFSGRFIQTVWGGFLTTIEFNGRLFVDTKNPNDPLYQNFVDPFVLEANDQVTSSSIHKSQLDDCNEQIIKIMQLSTNSRNTVHLCIDKQYKRRCILKAAFCNRGTDRLMNSAITRVQWEAEILKRLADDCIAPQFYKDYFDQNGNYCLIQEDFPGETLSAFSKKIIYDQQSVSIGQITDITIKLAHIIFRLHEKKIVHGDLKLSNILIDAHGNLCLIDFDSSCDYFHQRLTATAGSTGFITYNRNQGGEPRIIDDIYAFGACIYYLFTGVDSDVNPLEVNQHEVMTASINPEAPNYICYLIKECLTQNLFSFKEVINILTYKIAKTTHVSQQSSFSYEDKLHYIVGKIIENGYDTQTGRFNLNGIIAPSIEINDLRGISGDLLAFTIMSQHGFSSRATGFAIPKYVNQIVSYKPDYNLIPGLYAGEAGKALALLYSSYYGSNITWKKYAAELLGRANQLPLRAVDLYHGTAGLLRVNLIFYVMTNERRYLSAAKRQAKYLLECREIKNGHYVWYCPTVTSTTEDFKLDKEKIYFGYAHGLAGIADALLDYYLLTGCKETQSLLCDIGKNLLDNQQETYGGQALAWSAEVGGELTQPYWCHGAAGIGIFLARMMRSNLIKSDMNVIQKIMHSIFLMTKGGSVILCHGALGSMESLLDISLISNISFSETWIKTLEEIIANWLRHYFNNRLKTSNKYYNHFGYLDGICATLVVYTRLCTKSLPNPLSLDYSYYLKEHKNVCSFTRL